MSFRQDQLPGSSSVHQESFFLSREQNDDISPHLLSGEESGEQSVHSVVDGQHKANFTFTVITIVKSILGAGMVAMPYTVRKLGWLFSLVVFGMAIGVHSFSCMLMLKNKNLSGHSNFATIAMHIWRGKTAKIIGSVFTFFCNMGMCMATIIIFKTTIRKLLEDFLGHDSPILGHFYTSEYAIAVVSSLIEFPFILVKKMEKLRCAALVGVAGIIIFMGSFIVHYFVKTGEGGLPERDIVAYPEDWFKAMAVVPTIFLSLTFQQNFFPIFKGMRKAGDRKMLIASCLGIGISAVAYALFGLLGYSLTGSDVQDNFLESIPYSDTNLSLFILINSGFLISNFATYPLMFFGCRNTFIAIIQVCCTSSREKPQRSQLTSSDSPSWRAPSELSSQMSSDYVDSEQRRQRKKRESRQFFLYTLLLYLVIMGVGVTVDSIEAVFNIVGAVSGTALAVMMPGYFYVSLVTHKKKKKRAHWFMAVLLMGIMLPFALFSIVANYLPE